MAAVKPVAPRSRPTHGPAGATGRLLRTNAEVTVTRPLDASTTSKAGRPDPDIDWSDSSTLARGVGASSNAEDEPCTLARPPLGVHEAETRRQLDLLLDGRDDPSKPILENDVSTPVVDKSALENEIKTLTKAARELETLPREVKKLVLEDRSDNTAATLVRRDSIPPPALPPPVLPPPLETAAEPPTTVRNVPEGDERTVTTGASPAGHTGSLPWIPSMPGVDPTPPASPAIRTPLVMVSPVEDNLTRVAPLAPPLVVHPPPTPIPYPQLGPARRLPLQRMAIAGAGVFVFLAAFLAVVAIGPRATATSAAQASEHEPVVAVDAPPIAPPVAAPPATPEPARATTPASATASTTTPPPPSTTRAQPRRRHVPAKPAGRQNSRPRIPSRREP